MAQDWTFLVILLFHIKYNDKTRPESPEGGLYASP